MPGSQSDPLASILTDEALVAALVPWACPTDFGPGDRYRLEELIGAGRESVIYLATDRQLSSAGFAAPVAVKIASSLGSQLRLDALSGRRISHRNVLSIIDHGVSPEGIEYVVAEYVDGGDLSSQRVPMPPREAALFLAKLARGVQAAHAAGVIHCDLKPANVLLTRDGEPKLGDFDLCRPPEDEDNTPRGNLAFMAPEQLSGDPAALTPPADIYALGGLLFWLLTGRCANGDTAESIHATLPGREHPPSPGIERDLDLICERALATRPELRHHSAGELADDLDRWLRHEVIPWAPTPALRRVTLWAKRRPTRAVLVVAAAVIVIGTVAFQQQAAAEARARQARAQALAVEIANNSIEETKAKVRAHLRFMYNFAASGDPEGIQDRVLPMLVWLEWLVDTPVIGEDARISLAADRVEALRSMTAQINALGGPARLDDLLARYSLAYFLIEAGDSAEATGHLAKVREVWAPRLHPDDPIWVAITALEACAGANAAAARGDPPAEIRRQLDEARQMLGLDGFAPVARLIERTTVRLFPP